MAVNAPARATRDLRRSAWWLALLAVLALAAMFSPARADVLPVPSLDARVIDRTGTLDEAQRRTLEARLAALEGQRGTQVVVLMVPTTAPEDIAAFAQRVADQWKIGRRTIGDGVLVVVAKDDRRMRIEVAKALEGAITDLAARRILDDTMRPAFREGDYAGGLRAAVDQLEARIRGEALPEPETTPATTWDDGAGLLENLGVFLFVAVPIVATVLRGLFGRKLAALVTAGVAGGVAWWLTTSLLIGLVVAVIATVVAATMGVAQAARRIGRGRDGGWGGGWSGGGLGGGGDFGGGGASGSW